VLVSDGKSGAYVGSPKGVVYCPAMTVKVAGTAGAGDAFASTFAAMIAEGTEPDDAILAGVINSGSVITFIDTQSGLLRRPQLDERLAAARKEVAVQTWPA